MACAAVTAGGGVLSDGVQEVGFAVVGQAVVGTASGGAVTLQSGIVPCFGAGAQQACICGDLDGSGGATDLGDFNVFQVCFGLRAPTAQCPQVAFDCADLNQDNWVNLTDFNTFQVLFGTVSSNSPPNCP
jgi:hypothetical protein